MNKVIDAPQGEKITMDGNNLKCTNKPIIPFIEGDGLDLIFGMLLRLFRCCC